MSKLFTEICKRHLGGEYIFNAQTFQKGNKETRQELYYLYKSNIIRLAEYDNQIGFALSPIGIESQDFLNLSNYEYVQKDKINYLTEKEFFKKDKMRLETEFDYILDTFKISNWEHKVEMAVGLNLCAYPVFRLIRPKKGAYSFVCFDNQWFLSKRDFTKTLNYDRNIDNNKLQISSIFMSFASITINKNDVLTILDKLKTNRVDFILCEMTDKIIPIMQEATKLEVTDVWIEPKNYSLYW